MNDRLRLIRHLYDEDDAPAALMRRMAKNDALRREYEELRAVKSVIDDQPSRSPHPDVVDHVVETASAAARQADKEEPTAPDAPSRAADRDPQAPSHDSRARRVRRTSAALAIVLLAALGWWAVPTTLDSSSASRSDGSTGTPSTAAATGANATTETGTPQGAESMPAWDDRDELVRLHRRIERLRTRDSEWAEGLQAAQARP